MARQVGAKMSESLGQPVIVDHRPGAGGNIGASAVAKANPDGYTILLTVSGLAASPSLYKSLTFDPLNDLAPVTQLAASTMLLVVTPKLPVRTTQELIAFAKAKPGGLNFGSSGVGAPLHLTMEIMKHSAGIDMVHVPFRGAGPAAQAVLANQIQVASVALAAAEPLIKSGDLKALAVTGEKRWFSLPDVPTMIESGYPGFVSDTFNALFVPAGTPPDIVEAIVKSSQAAMRRPEALEAARKAGFEVVAGTPDQLARRVATEIEGVRELVAKAGIKTEN
jgi:tripartite-type tricarboxylate transporter receptor subunit TctC